MAVVFIQMARRCWTLAVAGAARSGRGRVASAATAAATRTMTAAAIRFNARGRRAEAASDAITSTSTTAASHADRVVALTRKTAITAAANAHATAGGVSRIRSRPSPAAARPSGSVATTYCAAMFLFTKVAAGGTAWYTRSTPNRCWASPSAATAAPDTNSAVATTRAGAASDTVRETATNQAAKASQCTATGTASPRAVAHVIESAPQATSAASGR